MSLEGDQKVVFQNCQLRMWEAGSAASRSIAERARLQLLGMPKRLRERVHLHRFFSGNRRRGDRG